MAQLLPDPPAPQGASWPRDWHDYVGYEVAHHNSIRDLTSEGIIIENNIRFTDSLDRRGHIVAVSLEGMVVTGNGARVTVRKALDVAMRHGQLCVLTKEYVYHARAALGKELGQELFRIDNCHGDVVTLHRLRFDVNGEEYGKPIALVQESLPTLNIMIRQADFLAGWLKDYLQRHQPDVR